MRHLIGGQLILGKGEVMTVLNPATGEAIETFSGVDQAQALSALEAARDAFPAWSGLTQRQREAHILRLAQAIQARKEDIIRLLRLETGKPRDNAEYDYQMLVDCLYYFNEEVKRLHGEIIDDPDDSHRNYIRRAPVGVVVGYLAWNFPLLNVGYKLGPVLASGCTCVLKPASLTPLATLLIGEITAEAGLPAGVVNIVSGRGDICQAMNASPIPAMLTMIGSSETGKRLIAQSCGTVKRYSLELGGNAPVVLLEDADAQDVARRTVNQKFDNCGQVCVSPNRVLVPQALLETFLAAAAEEAGKLVLTCQEGEGKQIGPMISAQAREHMEALVADALEKGARLVCGGHPAEGPGFYFQPTILADVTPRMRVYQEEIFGPLLPVIAYGPQEDVVALANDTCYGLAGYLYTNDLTRAFAVAEGMRFGSVSVNEPFYAFNLPHGGVKESGVGKDCSHFSLEEYMEVRRVSVKR